MTTSNVQTYQIQNTPTNFDNASSVKTQQDSANNLNITFKIPSEFKSISLVGRQTEVVKPDTNSENNAPQNYSYEIIEEYEYMPSTSQNRKTFTIQKISTPKLPGTHSKDESSTPSNGPQVLYQVNAGNLTTTFVDPNCAKQYIDELGDFEYQDKTHLIEQLSPSKDQYILSKGGIACACGNIHGFTIGNQEKWSKQAQSTSKIPRHEYQDCQTPDQAKIIALKTLKQYSKCIDECMQKLNPYKENIFQKIWNILVKLFASDEFQKTNNKQRLHRAIDTIQEELTKLANDENLQSQIDVQCNNLRQEIENSNVEIKDIEIWINNKLDDIINNILDPNAFFSTLPNKIDQIIRSRENKIVTLERNMGGNNIMQSGGRVFVGLQDGLATALQGYFKSVNDGNPNASLMHSFAEQYGKDTLDHAVKLAITTAHNKQKLVDAYKQYYKEHRKGEECPSLQLLNDDLQELYGRYKEQTSKENNTETTAKLENEFENYKKEHATTDGATWELNIGDLTIMVNPGQEKNIPLSALVAYYVE